MLTQVLPAITALLICALTAWINITIKHAPDKQSAVRGTVLIFARIFALICAAGALALLIREVLSPEPLTRLSVFFIALDTSALFVICLLQLISWMSEGLWAAIHRNLEALNKFISTLSRHDKT